MTEKLSATPNDRTHTRIPYLISLEEGFILNRNCLLLMQLIISIKIRCDLYHSLLLLTPTPDLILVLVYP